MVFSKSIILLGSVLTAIGVFIPFSSIANMPYSYFNDNISVAVFFISLAIYTFIVIIIDNKVMVNSTLLVGLIVTILSILFMFDIYKYKAQIEIGSIIILIAGVLISTGNIVRMVINKRRRGYSRIYLN